MPSVFLISDTHLGHANMLTFKNWDGSPVRAFSSVEEMDETIVDNWNRVVKPGDKVYHLGDAVMNKKSLPIFSRLNGKKVLIKGNHDTCTLKQYAEHFYDIRGSHLLDNFILSHIPVHPAALEARWCNGNIHGHLHNNLVMMDQVADSGIGEFIDQVPDPRYFNMSVERINYTPVAFEDLVLSARNRKNITS